MPYINIDNLIIFAPNVGVMVKEEALSVSPTRLFETIQLAYSHMNDKPLVDACCGARGPLADYGELSYEDYLVILEQIRVGEATQAAKRMYTQIRRADFNPKRAMLVLNMIDAGVSHVCAFPNCSSTEDLTIDHIVPLSRGGSDEIKNLRFLCRAHNSMKGDRSET